MTAEAKKALDRKNREYLAKKKAKREAWAAARAGKRKMATQSSVKDETAGSPQRKTGKIQPDAGAKPSRETVAEVGQTAPAANAAGHVTLRELKGQIKERWPMIRGLADATKAELMDVRDRGTSEPLLLETMQALWERRAKERRERWLSGDSKSALAAQGERDSRQQ